MNVNSPPSETPLPRPEDILSSHFTLTHMSDEIEPFEISGIEGWRSPNRHPVLSIGKWKTSDIETATAGLDEVLKSFRGSGRGFDWMTGPQDEDFLPLLRERGFLAPALSVGGMVRDISRSDLPKDSDGISTRVVEGKRNAEISTIMAQGFDVPEDVARIYHNAYVQPSDLQRTDVYVAAKKGESHPSGLAYLSYIGDGNMVLLRVAATLASSRGCGMYRSLIKRRLADAAKAGREIAVVHAYSTVSQGVLTELGFIKVCDFQLHRWRP